MESHSSTTPDFKRKLSRSGVDENTSAISGSFDKTIAVPIVALSVTKIGCPHADVHTVEGEQTICDNDNVPVLTGQYPVSSTHQVDKLLILPCEFEDSNQIIDVELLTERSIEGSREVIDELHNSLKTSVNLG